jgi:hypothetical protein
MNAPKTTGWVAERDDEWTCTLNGLLLRVTADPDDPNDPWTWVVLEVEDDVTEYEVGLGGAVSREAAMAAAEDAALKPEGNA